MGTGAGHRHGRSCVVTSTNDGRTAVRRVDGMRGLVVLPNGYERICDDFERTTGHTLALRSALDEFVGRQFPIVEVLLDGIHVGGFGLPGGHSADEVVAALADALQEAFLDEFIWGGWPTCPQHHTHPLQAVVVRGTATWSCPTDERVVSAIGALTELG